MKLLYISLLLLLSVYGTNGFHYQRHGTSTLSSLSSPSSSSALASSSSRSFDESSSSSPFNGTALVSSMTAAAAAATTAKNTRKVFVNGNYIPPPPRVIPQRVVTTTSTQPQQPQHENDQNVMDAPPPTRVELRGAELVIQLGSTIRTLAADFEYQQQSQSHSHSPAVASKSTIRSLLQEGGESILDMGRAWKKNDWESVTYAALEASQTFQLAASAIQTNDRHTNRDALFKQRKNNKNMNNNNNLLQQAIAGIGVELKVLSKTRREPRPGNLQGLSLRLYQASQHSKHKSTRVSFGKASKLARDLANQYGASTTSTTTTIFQRILPRQWQLWWRESQPNDDEDDNNE